MQTMAYLNGELIDSRDLTISPTDAGFVLGTTVTEQLRTFGGELFRLEDHLQRLEESLHVVGITTSQKPHELADAARDLVMANRPAIQPEDDLGLCIFATPGPYRTFEPQAKNGPNVGMHTYQLPFDLWSHQYTEGARLIVSQHRQTDPESWPLSLKCRSRLHYYLADQQVRASDAGARALLLNRHGQVSETSTANVVAYYESEGVVSPPRHQILPGISLQHLQEITDDVGIAFCERSLTPDELLAADEVLLTSTPFCILPVTQLNGAPIGTGKPGAVGTRLLAVWGNSVDIDIVAQAQRFSVRKEAPNR